MTKKESNFKKSETCALASECTICKCSLRVRDFHGRPVLHHKHGNTQTNNSSFCAFPGHYQEKHSAREKISLCSEIAWWPTAFFANLTRWLKRFFKCMHSLHEFNIDWPFWFAHRCDPRHVIIRFPFLVCQRSENYVSSLKQKSQHKLVKWPVACVRLDLLAAIYRTILSKIESWRNCIYPRLLPIVAFGAAHNVLLNHIKEEHYQTLTK